MQAVCEYDAKKILKALVGHETLSREEMAALMGGVLAGDVSEAALAGILVALRMRGETVDELVGAAQAMRRAAYAIEVADADHLLDTCGTGGDNHRTFNVSTTSAIVAAAAGVRVAKHGGRAVSSKSGSMDVLEALGVQIDLGPAQAADCLDAVGLTFLCAPQYHTAMKCVAPVRNQLGIRSLFNMLGPLTNPAGAGVQVVGVFDRSLVKPFALALHALGARRALVVHGADGLDELTIGGASWVAELCDGRINEYQVEPEQIGLARSDISHIRVNDVEASRKMMLSALANEASPARDIVALNAGAAIYIAGHAATLVEGVHCAHIAIASGAARRKLELLIEFGRRESPGYAQRAGG